MRISDYKDRIDFEYFRAWRILKGTLVKEINHLEELIRCGEQIFVNDELFTTEIINREKARKEILESILEYMNDMEGD